MSTTTAVAPPIATEIPLVPERLYSVERAKFAENFNRRPFMLDHSLSGHPAFTMDRLHSLLERSLPIPNKVYWNAGKKRIDQRWDDRPGRDFSIDEAFRRIRETDAWIIIFGADRDPEIHELLEKGLAEVQEMTGIPLNKEAKSRQSIIFITRRIVSRSTTSTGNAACCCRCTGKRRFTCLIRPTERYCRKRSWSVSGQPIPMQRSINRRCRAGRARFYWSREKQSTFRSMRRTGWRTGMTFSVRESKFRVPGREAGERVPRQLLCNTGFHPLPPGQSHTRDLIKAHGMRLPSFVSRRARAIAKSFRGKEA